MPIKMKKQTQHSSVSDLVQSLSEDREFADEFSKRISDRRLIKALAVLRSQADLSQQQLAELLNCTQSKISKLECSADADVRLGDLLDYVDAVEHEMRIILVPKGRKIVDDVKMHACIIKRLLDRMVRRAEEDGELTRGVADFLEDAAFNLVRIVMKVAATLPAMPEDPSISLQVETPDFGEEVLARSVRTDPSVAEDTATSTHR